jgi:heme/copper-type cytochrome/quinol oxidase subunit 4
MKETNKPALEVLSAIVLGFMIAAFIIAIPFMVVYAKLLDSIRPEYQMLIVVLLNVFLIVFWLIRKSK